jgi:predicted metal-dependent hydrolase
VIVHELLHFAVPHHGKLWKSLMRAHLGDYETLDNRLKRQAAQTKAGRKGLTSISRQ